MAKVERPLSPHLQIYKPQLTAILSIVHRGTGVFLSLGALLLCFWLLAVAAGPTIYAEMLQHLTAWYGKLLAILFVFSLFYHLCNGIRHLFWDAGLGLELKATYQSGYLVVITSLLMTFITYWLGMCSVGGVA